MLSNLSQYSPQGFVPQFHGLQGAGWPQMGPGPFAQPGAYPGLVPFAHEPALTGMYPSPFLQTPFAATPFAATPFAPAIGYNPLLSLAGYAGAHHPAQQIVLVLGQLAQQISVQTALTQQISIALQQLVHQLAVQGLQIPGAGLGAFGGQYFAQNPFAGATQGAYGGFSPQAQVWGANRAQTIQ
ncbi:MAG: hypothetical protein E6K20_01190 [Gammaproteobacteria bacterium]|nr:MAG: hypothetical protein E6K20_01190 [Gammaproteobacteria bacterium]